MAGTRAGLAGSRSGLFMEQIRVVKEMRNAERRKYGTDQPVHPRFFGWENVPGATSSGTPPGEDFRVVLEEIVRIKCSTVHVPRPYTGKWQSAGRIFMGDYFSLAFRMLGAQYWGLAQRRKRLFLVADLDGASAPQILFEPESLPGYFEEST